MTDTVPAGWYPDPTADDRLRWWDGTAWTTRYADEESPATAPTPRSRRLPLPLLIAGAGALVAGIAAVVALVILPTLSSSPEDVARRYTQAWWNADCAGFLATTSARMEESFTEVQGVEFSCDTFVEHARDFYGSTTEESLEVLGVTLSGDSAGVVALESWIDESGQPGSTRWTFGLVREGGVWVVESEFDEVP